MKLLLSTLGLLLIFSGCSTKTQNYRLRNKNAQQSAMIKKQQALINLLNSQLKVSNPSKNYARIQKVTPVIIKTKPIPKAPKKEIKLKKVEDSNYSSNYMYPKEREKKVTVQPIPSVSSAMTKSECIAMIGEEKLTKYTQMFGSESASLKRCKMLKAMKH
jgi:hypothetical protein